MNFVVSVELTSHRRLLAITYYSVVIVTENHVRFC